MNVSPFEAYKKYLALKLHFTSKSYDYFKFNGAVKADQSSFQKRRDKYWFTKISKRFNAEEFERFLLANFIADESSWIGEIADEQGQKNYLDWLKKVESLQYVFKEDITKLLENGMDFNSLFKKPTDENYPPIVFAAMRGQISLETFIIVNIIFDFIPKADKMISESLIWPEFKQKCSKYQPFIAKRISIDDFKKILKKSLRV